MPHPADPVSVDPGPPPAGHAAHDAMVVAAYAAGDATGRELEAATALVAACSACAALYHDLRAIAEALPEMPVPRRPRDFRLTPGQAASLRPAGWRRLLAPFAGPRFALAAPLGSGLAALGLAGILLAGTGLPLGGATSGGAEQAQLPAAAPTVGDTTASVPAASAAPAPVMPAPAAAPEASMDRAEPAGGIRTAGTEKAGAGPDASAGIDASAGPVAGQAAAGASAASPAAAGASEARPGATASIAGPSAGPPDASSEAVRVTGARDGAAGSPAYLLLALAVAMVVLGVAMTGLRVLSRRLA